MIFHGELNRLRADTSEKGKVDELSKYIRSHNQRHADTGPGPECVPLTSATLLDWVLDLLHVDLNLGKLAWNSQVILAYNYMDLLKLYGLPWIFGPRRRAESCRILQDKFFDGGEWQTFWVGTKESPRGQMTIAETMLCYRCGARAGGSSNPTKRSRGGAVVYKGSGGEAVDVGSEGKKQAEEMPWKKAFDQQAKERGDAARDRDVPPQLARNLNSVWPNG
eukprot:6192215-Pleurochrysis_carterae.AAC.1